jgi:hypothetical protein
MTTTSSNDTRALDAVAASWWVPALLAALAIAGWLFLTFDAGARRDAAEADRDDQTTVQRCLEQVAGMPMLRRYAELRSCFTASGHALGE